jgi:3-oxoacyl-[acyl-carrier protein] reductase
VGERCRALGADTLTLVGDIADEQAVNQMVDDTITHFGRIDVLANLVKIRPAKPFVDVSAEEWRRVMAVNLDAMFYLCKAVVPPMMERRVGSIIAFSQPFVPRYLGGHTTHILAAKYGVLGLVNGLAIELGPYGIRVNAIGPGRIETERRHPEWYGTNGEVAREDIISHIPLGRAGTTDEVAATAVFLASDESSYITGTLIPCNGGQYSLLE